MKRKLNVKASDFANKISKYYIEDEKIQAIAVDCYMDKRPKTYPEVYMGIYELSKNSKIFFHIFSWIIALPFLNFLVVLMCEKMGVGTPAPFFGWAVGAIILAFAEYGQSKTLDTLFKVFFQDGETLVPGLLVLAGLFSLFSIASSGYSAYVFLGATDFMIWGVGLSLFVEIMIITNSYNIHNFRYKTAKTLNMLNDFANQSPTAENPLVPYFDSPAAPKITVAKPMSKINGHTKKPNGQHLYNNATKPVVTANKQRKDKAAWTAKDIKDNHSVYEKRLAEKETPARLMQQHFWTYIITNWKTLQSGGVVPVVDIDMRKRFYNTKDATEINNFIHQKNAELV